jgi:hypothetical protein
MDDVKVTKEQAQAVLEALKKFQPEFLCDFEICYAP